MTENEALKILAQQEKRFKDAGFGRGVVLAKSAHDYHKAILDWRKKADACAADYNAAKKRLDAFTAELKRKEAQSRKLLDWRKKADACAADYNAAKKRLDAFTADLKRKEAQSRKLLDDIARIRKVCVPLKKTVRNGDILKTRERQAQRRFVEKVDLLARMEIA